jgi:hypothetical protein
LKAALDELTDTCKKPKVESAHCIGCGFEDEAPALSAWKRGTGYPRTLTIHCETEGDMISYGPAADELV